ncbi:UNVERIFIED_CONTAM: hypothetical protein GTU68_057918 [Idotea baltica]|nr:hypothetical protein [Idotea baltica]
MKYLHTMVRVTDVDASLRFYCDGLGLQETRRIDNEKGRFTLVIFSSAPGGESAQFELTHNWIREPYGEGAEFSGHWRNRVATFCACHQNSWIWVVYNHRHLDGHMAFVPLAGQYFGSNWCKKVDVCAPGAWASIAEYRFTG